MPTKFDMVVLPRPRADAGSWYATSEPAPQERLRSAVTKGKGFWTGGNLSQRHNSETEEATGEIFCATL